jgi:hypothetical protein
MKKQIALLISLCVGYAAAESAQANITMPTYKIDLSQVGIALPNNQAINKNGNTYAHMIIWLSNSSLETLELEIGDYDIDGLEKLKWITTDNYITNKKLRLQLYQILLS